MSSIFDNPDYKPLERIAGKVAINVRKNCVSFSKQLLFRLGYAHYVQVFINHIEKKLGIKVCEENDPNAIKFVPKDKQKTDSLRWNNPQFTNDIRSLVSEDLSNQDFVCAGIYLPEENAVLLDMSSATPLD